MLAPARQLEFNYGDLEARAVRSLESHAKAINATQEKVRRTTAEGVLKIGEELKAAHDLLAGKGRDGMFSTWAKLRCGINKMAAYRAMAAHATFGANKRNNLLLFDASALYLLSADSCPEEASEEAIKLAESGERVTHKVAKELKKKYDPPDEEEEAEEEDEEEETDSLVWDFSECLSSVRREVNRWKRVCPKSQIETLAQLLQDLSKMVEKKRGSK